MKTADGKIRKGREIARLEPLQAAIDHPHEYFVHINGGWYGPCIDRAAARALHTRITSEIAREMKYG